MARMHNFSAGPAVLPVPVIEQLQDVLLELDTTGVGLMEASHRSPSFEAIINGAEERLRRILSVPSDYAILFQQGGASLQFYAAALNLLRPGDAADYLVTGVWSKKAVKEASRVGDARAIWDGEATVYNGLPLGGGWSVRDEAVYLHYTSNNTIYGTQWPTPPDAAGKLLLCDMSSDICSRPVDMAAHDIIYAGAQKNLGPSGVAVVILSPRALERAPGGLPSMLDYRLQHDKGSMFNTPNTFGIFALERVLAWLEDQGGLSAVEATNKAKAATLYNELDRTEFWTPHAERDCRSLMNVAWRAPTPELEAQFLKEADAAGLKSLKGHRSVGGLRASIYNACPTASVDALVEFMAEFERSHG